MQPLDTTYGKAFAVAAALILAANLPAPALGQSSGWQEFGGGASGTVHGFAIDDHFNDLYVGGAFQSIGGNSYRRVAGWDGAGWFGMGSGMNNTIRGLALMENGALAAGGLFSNAGGTQARRIALWGGAAWNALSTGAQQNVYAVAIYNGEIIIGGAFTSPASRIARWDAASGTWRPLGEGLSNDVLALHVHNGLLIAGGKFGLAGGSQARRVAAWDGSSWMPLGADFGGYVRALTTYNGDLVAGGDPLLAPGGSGIFHVARWNPVNNTWSALGGAFDGRIRALVEYDGDLIAGGEFTSNDDGQMSRVGRWDGFSEGGGWLPLEGGVNDTVWALAVYDNELIVGGDFTSASGSSASRLARWTLGEPGEPSEPGEPGEPGEPPLEPESMSVSEIVLSTVNIGQGFKRGQAIVTIVDDLGQPVEGAEVSGVFFGDFNENPDPVVTNAQGQATFQTTGAKKGNVNFAFCVMSVAHDVLVWDEVETCAP